MKIRFLLPLIFFILIGLLLWRGLSLHPNEIPSPLIGKASPTFSLPTLLGTKATITEKDLKGHVTLLNVWATWCYACALEHEYLMELASHKDFKLFGFNYKDDNIAARHWLKEHGNPYEIIAVDVTGTTAIDWGVYGTPETFLIDKNSIIRYKQIGPITQEVWEKTLRPLVEKLENEA
ncbi:MAG: DsbE family thiol:disulfide interchange protein [Gammaproteobacteria bacterium]|nr:DsbE family thiol:disulfide interchange protein [Gammaproteobacteria bacterium]